MDNSRLKIKINRLLSSLKMYLNKKTKNIFDFPITLMSRRNTLNHYLRFFKYGRSFEFRYMSFLDESDWID